MLASLHIRRLSLLIAIGVLVGLGAVWLTSPETAVEAPEEDAPPPLESPTPVELTLADLGLDAAAIDRAADPCQDFYRFACGRWEDGFQLPPKQKRWVKGFSENAVWNQQLLHTLLTEAAREPADDPMMRRVGDYYAACMDEEAIDKAGLGPLLPLVGEIEALRNGKPLELVLAALHRAGVPALFRLKSSRISENDQDGTVLELTGDWGDVPLALDTSARGGAGGSPLARAFVALGQEATTAEKSVRQAMQVRDELYAAGRLRGSGSLLPLPVVEVRSMAGPFRWANYLRALGCAESERVRVDPTLLNNLAEVLRREPPPALADYLLGAVVAEFGMDLPRSVGRFQSFQRFLESRFHLRSERPGYCIREAQRSLPDEVGQIYGSRVLPGAERLVAWGLAGSIEQRLKGGLPRVPWLDGASREAAMRKMDRMTLQIGYPMHFHEHNFPVDRGQWLADRLAANREAVDRELEAVGQPFDHDRWPISPSTVNAMFDPTGNTLMFPAGILSPPFFLARRASAVNYGAMGAVMGHELTHALDESGSHIDADGRAADWWSSPTRQAFRETESCVIERYPGYQGVRQIEENVADIGGVEVAFSAWWSSQVADRRVPITSAGFDERQLFFLAYAQTFCEKGPQPPDDPHAPGRLRVNVPLSQTTGFRAAFGCSAGSPMSPRKRCEIW